MSEPTVSEIKKWTFDTHREAQLVVNVLNSGERVTRAMHPKRYSYQAGWGLTRNERGVWRVKGLGF